MRVLLSALVLFASNSAFSSVYRPKPFLAHAENAAEAHAFLNRLNLFGVHHLSARPVFHYSEGPGETPKETASWDDRAPAGEFLFAVQIIPPFDLSESRVVDEYRAISGPGNYGLTRSDQGETPYGYYRITMTDAHRPSEAVSHDFHLVEFDEIAQVLHLEVPGGFFSEDRTQLSIWTRMVKGVEQLFITTYQSPHAGFASRTRVDHFLAPRSDPNHEQVPRLDVLAQRSSRRVERVDDVYIALVDAETDRQLKTIPAPRGIDINVSLVGPSLVIEVPGMKRRLVYSAVDGRYLHSQDIHEVRPRATGSCDIDLEAP